MTQHRLQISAELSQLATVRRFVETAGASLNVSRALTEPLILAVDESLSNIIQHGYQQQTGTITIEVERAADALIVRLQDQAPPFDPTARPDPDVSQPLHQRPVGGLGVYLTRRSVDSVSYERTPAGDNRLTLIKKIPPS
jgi:serine/threonine-protein kinase RsbW